MYKSIFSENKKDKIIYLDMDGVLTDFIKHYKNYFGIELSWNDHRPDEEIFNNINKIPHWWLSMPWTKNGKILLNKCQNLCNNIKLLTTPAYSVEHCKEDKRNWVKKEIGKMEVIFSFNKEKYANKNSILIDDKKENIDKFNDAGGTGLLYDNHIKVINKLENIFK